MEDLSKQWKSLSLSDKEGQGLTLNSDQATKEFSMVARFLTKRPINLDAIANTFNPLWRTKSGFRMKFIGNHLILFSFDYKEDVDRILAAEPWSFDKHIMVVSRFDNAATVDGSNFTTEAFWVQIHDIPLRFRNRDVAEQICEAMGNVIQMENPNDWDGGSFIRLRVAINISQPLCRGRLITLDNDEVHWVFFKYECLPNVCYWCGCLTYQNKDCEKWIDSEGSLSKEHQHFGPWLRATPVTISKKGSLSVPGFYAHKKAKQKGQNRAGTQYQTQEPPAATEWVAPQNTPPKSQLQTVNLAADNSAEVTAPTSVASAPPLLVLPMKPTQPFTFDQVIEEIDKDIHRFDKVVPAQKIPMDSNPEQSILHTNGPNTSKSPLSDTSKNSQAQDTSDTMIERKWTRIQRPNLLSIEEPLVTSLGKRGPLPFTEESTPQKRRATSEDGAPSSSPQTAVADRQPRRAR